MTKSEPFDNPASDEILKFLSDFESPAFQFGCWHNDGEGLPEYELRQVARSFVKTLYKTGWVVSFDWSEWQDAAARYVDSKEAVRTADVATLQKLLTTHVRKDRFCEGHLAAMFESGHLTAILRRIHTFREGSTRRS